MNDMKIFENSEFGAVRVVDVNGEPWFVARDVASALGYVDTTQAIRMHCEKAKDFRGVEMTATATPMKIIPEEDVYALIFGSRLESAKQFRRWICDEVLPAIRKHGGYLTPAKLEEALTDPDTIIRLATNLKAEREKRQALEAQAAADRPKVVFAESIEVAKTSILVGEMAKLIKQATGCDMGQNRFFEWLRANGYLHKGGSARNMPTQRCIDAGWMEIKEGTRIGSSGECHITRTPKVTGKGQIYFVNLFREMKAA
ncbi:phage antirepressor [Desulfovibrio piger]|uniref:phage antirepressor n=1 Tax=Desulfovibrio piger TaxID=901 RepID=UPI001D2EE3A9|nr:phage antirepressor [Desulfovibrio piger]HJG35857.1 phage antirepressor [Desulfovibrio piger]